MLECSFDVTILGLEIEGQRFYSIQTSRGLTNEVSTKYKLTTDLGRT